METKFNQFITRLEEKELSTSQENLLLTNSNEQASGGSTNRSCSNTTSSCNGSVNRNCTNYNAQGCETTTNKGWGGCTSGIPTSASL